MLVNVFNTQLSQKNNLHIQITDGHACQQYKFDMQIDGDQIEVTWKTFTAEVTNKGRKLLACCADTSCPPICDQPLWRLSRSSLFGYRICALR